MTTVRLGTSRKAVSVILGCLYFTSCSQNIQDGNRRSLFAGVSKKGKGGDQSTKASDEQNGSEGSESFPQGQESVPGTGVYLTYENARVRCSYFQEAPQKYRTACQAVILQDDGIEIMPTKIKDNTSLSWSTPNVQEGRAKSLDCLITSNLLEQRCVVTTEPDIVRIAYEVKLSKKEQASERTESASLLLPYSVGVSGGFVPNMPFLFKPADLMNFVKDATTSTALGFQLTAQKALTDPVDRPNSFCLIGNQTYFSSRGFIYRQSGDRVELFAGSNRSRSQEDLSQRYRINLSAEVDIACHKGTIYAADVRNFRILSIPEKGQIQLLAGGSPGLSQDGTTAAGASLGLLARIALSPGGELHFAESDPQNGIGPRIRKIDKDGKLKTIAGNGKFENSGDGGQALQAGFRSIVDLKFHTDGTIYIADLIGDVVRKIDPAGIVHRFAGTGLPGDDSNKKALESKLFYPYSLEIGRDGSVYIGEVVRGIKRVRPDGVLEKFYGDFPNLGTKKSFGRILFGLDPTPESMLPLMQKSSYTKLLIVEDNDKDLLLYSGPRSIQSITAGSPGTPKIFLGNDDPLPCTLSQLPAKSQILYTRSGQIAYDNKGHIVIGTMKDVGSSAFVLKKLYKSEDSQVIQALAGCDQPAELKMDPSIATPVAVEASTSMPDRKVKMLAQPEVTYGHDNAIYLAFQNRILKIAADNKITTLSGSSADASSVLDYPVSPVLHPNGSLYFIERGKGLIRKLSPDGRIDTVFDFGAPSWPATSRAEGLPVQVLSSLAIDKTGTLYFSDSTTIRSLSADGTTKIIAGNGNQRDGSGSVTALDAQLRYPSQLRFTSDGSLYFINGVVPWFHSDLDVNIAAVMESEDLRPSVKRLYHKEGESDTWQIDTVFGRTVQGEDCGSGVISGMSKHSNIANAVKTSLSVMCAGYPNGLTVRGDCTEKDGMVSIAISQTFADYTNVIEIKTACNSFKQTE